MITLRDINREEKAKLKDLEQKRKEVIATAESRRIKVKEFGGFVDRYEIETELEVSTVRVGVLINRGQFRECEFGYSLGDVRKYKKKRKTGQPKKTRKHNANQMTLKL